MIWSIVALSISAILMVIQIWNFFENRSEKKENKMNSFSKAADVAIEMVELSKGIEVLDKEAQISDDKIQKLEKNMAVLEERIDNAIDSQSKALDRANDKLDLIIMKGK